MFPDFVPRDVGLILAFHHAREGIEVVAVDLVVPQSLGLFRDKGIEVDVLLEVEEVLAVVFIEAEELAVDGQHNLLKDLLDPRLESASVWSLHHEAQVVAKFFRGGAQRSENVALCEAMNG